MSGIKLIIGNGADFSASALPIYGELTVKAGKKVILDGITYQAGETDESFDLKTLPTDYQQVAANRASLKNITVFKTAPLTALAFANNSALESVVFENGVSFSNDIKTLFYNCTALQSITFNSASNYALSDCQSMFNGCIELLSLDLSMFNLSAVTNTSKMFLKINKLETLDISGFNSANVDDYTQMFTKTAGLPTALTKVIVNGCSVETKTWLIARLASLGVYVTGADSSGNECLLLT